MKIKHEWVNSVLGILALVVTGYSLWRQEIQWTVVNAPRLQVTSVKWAKFGTVKCSEALNREKWGYDLSFDMHPQAGTPDTDECDFMSVLVIWNPVLKSPVPNTMLMRSVDDAKREAARLGIRRFELQKRLRMLLDFSNRGLAPATDVRVDIDIFDEQSKAWQNVHKTLNAMASVGPQESFNLILDAYQGINGQLNDDKLFALRFEYQFDGKVRRENRQILYSGAKHEWSWNR